MSRIICVWVKGVGTLDSIFTLNSWIGILCVNCNNIEIWYIYVIEYF